MNKLIVALLTLGSWQSVAQPQPVLTVEKIMQDPKVWIGTAPSSPFWSEDSKTIYFNWNPEKFKSDSLYKITLTGNRVPTKVALTERRDLPPTSATPASSNPRSETYNRARTRRLFERGGDIYLMDTRAGAVRRLTNTIDRESSPTFSSDEQHVVFVQSSNLFKLTIASGELTQLTNFDFGSKKAESKANDQETWLKKEQLTLFDVLRERKARRDEGEKVTKAEQARQPKRFYTEGRSVINPTLSPDGRFITFNLAKRAEGAKVAIVPNYVTESGFTEDIQARTKVGAPLTAQEFFVYDVQKDTAIAVEVKAIPGIRDIPDYLNPAATAMVASQQPVKVATDTTKAGKSTAKPADRKVYISGPTWSEDGRYAVVVVRSVDNKDRWLMLLDPATRNLKVLDRQRDEAWIGGPGIGTTTSMGTIGWVDNQSLYYQSEAEGYSHLYLVNVATGEKKQLTKGKFEVQQAQLSNDKRYFYLTTNEVHPGEQHFYRMSVQGGPRTKLTSMTGANDVTLSPDETKMVIRHSYSNQPWELYYAELKTDKRGNVTATQPVKLTNSLTNEFKAYPWRDPQLVTIKARDGTEVYERLYKPANTSDSGKAVIFVHGAGYLQNAHKWWSQYFREYMFHNLLVDKGYTVLDIDYRASAGYGRNWRTGIYRHMGGKDLTDHVDAAQWLVQNHGIDAKRIGIYGGSYGGFITLMAMFTQPDVFKVGAALRPVTDWAAYNHGYTANILNEPYADTLAYRRSSPIYFANGLKGHLLICHGMVDVNVHYQDVVRLAQRLIELKKDNWELASYPVEDHAFVEPTSWTDEFKRILKLFEEL